MTLFKEQYTRFDKMRKNIIEGLVFNIQRFSIHDGSGIRTLIFMKGCPLSCKWCANPESQNCSKEIIFFHEKCISCGYCAQRCTKDAISPITFDINRKNCSVCGACTSVCAADAKKVVGEAMHVSKVISDIEKDRVFYRNSNGGVTIGGGEPLVQHEFVEALLLACKNRNIHTAIETCGFADWDTVKKIFQIVDHVFYDLKHMDDERHKEITGVSNHIILKNAEQIVAMGKSITFRIPLIPGYNDEEENILQTGRFVKRLLLKNKNIKVEFLEYHGLGENKYNGLDRAYMLKGTHSDHIRLQQSRQMLKDMGITVIS